MACCGLMVGGSGIITFLFTDIEGSTRLWQADEEAMRSALARHDEVLRKTIAAHEGTVFSGTGDGMAAAFGSAAAVNGQISVLAGGQEEVVAPGGFQLGVVGVGGASFVLAVRLRLRPPEGWRGVSSVTLAWRRR